MYNNRDLSDEGVVKQVCDVDINAFRELIRRYQSKLLRYALYLIGDEDMASDVVQSSFIKAYINLRGFNTKLSFSSWIYRIVHNEAMNSLAKNKPHKTPDELPDIADDTNIEANFEKQELLEELEVCLNELPLMYRAPLSLFYLEDKSYTEVSDILRIPVGTVGTRINRARNMMRSLCRKRE